MFVFWYCGFRSFLSIATMKMEAEKFSTGKLNQDSRLRTVILNCSGFAKVPVLQECGADWPSTFRRNIMPSS